MNIFKINTLSTQATIILSALIIGISIFLTTWIFFGGDGNRQKLFIENNSTNRPTPANTMSPDQIKKMQEQRAMQINRPAPTATTTN